MDIIIGMCIGFLVAFFTLKSQIRKNGAGQLKVCKTCPYYGTPVMTGEGYDNE